MKKERFGVLFSYVLDILLSGFLLSFAKKQPVQKMRWSCVKLLKNNR